MIYLDVVIAMNRWPSYLQHYSLYHPILPPNWFNFVAQPLVFKLVTFVQRGVIFCNLTMMSNGCQRVTD